MEEDLCSKQEAQTSQTPQLLRSPLKGKYCCVAQVGLVMKSSYDSRSFMVADDNPGDNLITSTYSNGYPCTTTTYVNSPIGGGFHSAFRTLDRTFPRLMIDLQVPGVAIGIAYNNNLIFNGWSFHP